MIVDEMRSRGPVKRHNPYAELKPLEDYNQLLHFMESLYRDTSKSELRFGLWLLPEKLRNHFDEKFPVGDYADAEERIIDIKREVDEVLLPKIRAENPTPSRRFEPAAQFLTKERVLGDFETEQRLQKGIEQRMELFYRLRAADELEANKKHRLQKGRQTALIAAPPSAAPEIAAAAQNERRNRR